MPKLCVVARAQTYKGVYRKENLCAYCSRHKNMRKRMSPCVLKLLAENDLARMHVCHGFAWLRHSCANRGLVYVASIYTNCLR